MHNIRGIPQYKANTKKETLLQHTINRNKVDVMSILETGVYEP